MMHHQRNAHLIIRLWKLTLISLLLWGPFSSFAQVQLRLQAGYGVPMGTETWGINVVENSQSDFTTTAVHGTLGQGWQATLTAAYPLNSTISFELGFGYLHGGLIRLESREPDQLRQRDFFARQVRLMPSIVLFAGEGVWRPATRIGLILPIWNRMYEQDLIDYVNAPDRAFTRHIWTKPGVGGQAAIGMHYQGDRWGAFMEVGFQLMALARDRSEVVSITEGGVDILNTLSPSQREAIFLQEINSSGAVNPAEPTPQLTTHRPYSNLNISLGMSYSLQAGQE